MDKISDIGKSTRNGNALRLLAYVFAASDHGSLRQAARALRVRESSVSRNVVKLEQLLEMQLFERDVRGVRLTKTGRAWADVARTHYDGLLDVLTKHVGENHDAKTLRIGLCRVTGGKFLERLVRRFAGLYPGVNLIIQDVPAAQCLTAVRQRRLDIAFMHDLGSVTSCRSEVFWKERLFVLLPSTHPLAGRETVTWSDLAGSRVLASVGSEGSTLDLQLLERVGVDGSPLVEACPSSRATVIFKVQLGQGIMLAVESYARNVGIDSATWKPLQGQDSVIPVCGVWLESNPNRAVLRLAGIARNMTAAQVGTKPSP
ncbi:LysR family transcriptional regulator [Mesorhizobium sp. M1E.F.Ca.ET.063.01.1.1]|uniref:LysR family transcriptional regulator n=1 Tax=Mesorhizobium sp. M1E.F.Ca.ET.063.01.1.1 TaxID=2496750 RepID=UPI000FCC042B|nr:LysR family transcriptional regulator [Mesorhizobium sp. M1E.F.Ca.ET.063.01.1.1]RUW84495.1 LysR family transcriptional regulator [Mesorhizobium sp. M1E.F.Ca.ET.063.01.1.1]